MAAVFVLSSTASAVLGVVILPTAPVDEVPPAAPVDEGCESVCCEVPPAGVVVGTVEVGSPEEDDTDVAPVVVVVDVSEGIVVVRILEVVGEMTVVSAVVAVVVVPAVVVVIMVVDVVATVVVVVGIVVAPATVVAGGV